MTIRGNVMVCDQCGRQVSMRMEGTAGAKQSLNERVRSYAEALGWHKAGQRDLCPDHEGE
jgi:hypothetical protein